MRTTGRDASPRRPTISRLLAQSMKRLRHRQGTPRHSWRSREGHPLLLTAGYSGLPDRSSRLESLTGRRWRANDRTRHYPWVARVRISSVWALTSKSWIDGAGVMRRSESIPKAATIGKHNYGLSVYNGLGRLQVIGRNYGLFLLRFRIEG